MKKPSRPPCVAWSLWRTGSRSGVHSAGRKPAALGAGLELELAGGRARHEQHARKERRLLGRPPGREALQEDGAPALRRRRGLHAEERGQDRADLAIERARESPGRALELGLATLGLGPADLGGPLVLERGEHDEQDGERAEGRPQPAVPALSSPRRECSSGVGGLPTRSHRPFTSLTARLRRPDDSRRPRVPPPPARAARRRSRAQPSRSTAAPRACNRSTSCA